MSVVRVARPRAFVLLLASALLFASMVLVRPAEAVGSASISGVVTDGGGQPIAGVTVHVDRVGGDRTLWSTDGDGRFVAGGLPAGRYAVCFYMGKALVECWEDIEPALPRYTPVEVGDDQQVTGIDAVLVPSHLRGTVTDSRGDPVAGVLVSATWYPPDDPDHVVACCQSSVTAEDGSFDIGFLYSGEYKLQFSDRQLSRYASEWWDDAATGDDATRIRLVRGQSVDHLDAVLDDLPHITGRVRGAGGASARGALVRVFRVAAPEVFSEVDSSPLAADGSYDVGGLQPGTYRLEFDAAPGKYRTEYWHDVRTLDSAHDVVISETTPVTGVDAVLSLAPPVRVTRSPSLAGRARVGERLSVTNGTWDVRLLRFTYQWRADGSIIPRATGRRLLLTPRLRGKHISVLVKATATAHERSPGLATTRRTQPVTRTSH